MPTIVSVELCPLCLAMGVCSCRPASAFLQLTLSTRKPATSILAEPSASHRSQSPSTASSQLLDQQHVLFVSNIFGHRVHSGHALRQEAPGGRESILDGMKAPYAKKLYDAASLRFRENFQAPLIRYNEDNKTKYPCIRFSMVSHHPNHAISCLP